MGVLEFKPIDLGVLLGLPQNPRPKKETALVKVVPKKNPPNYRAEPREEVVPKDRPPFVERRAGHIVIDFLQADQVGALLADHIDDSIQEIAAKAGQNS